MTVGRKITITSLEGTMIVNSEYQRGQRRSARGRNIALLAILVVLAVMVALSIHWIRVIAARYDNDPVVASDPATGTPSPDDPSPSSPSPSASPSPSGTVEDPSEVGQTRIGENADTTLLQVRKVAAPAGREPAPGEEWFGIRAETCVHPDASPSGGVGWSSWLVIDEAGENHRGEDAPWDDFPPQQLPSTGIEPGECNIGWVLIGVPKGTAKTIETVVFRPTAPEPAEWAI